MQEMQKMSVHSLSREDPLEKEMATHSSILAWEIPWTEEPGGLQSMGLQESDTTEWLTLSQYKKGEQPNNPSIRFSQMMEYIQQ